LVDITQWRVKQLGEMGCQTRPEKANYFLETPIFGVKPPELSLVKNINV